MMENIAVALEEVSKHYDGGPEPVAAVSEVSLRIPAGEFVAILGPSGSGKSTLLNLIAGLDSPSAGRVLIGGRDLGYLGDNARSDLRLREIGFVFQSFNLFPTFTAEENVAWPLEFQGVRWREARRRAEAALAQVGLPPAAACRRPAQLSGGEQQRVAVARALVTEPRLLLADEPTGNLDSQTGQTILDLLRRLNVERHLTVVLVTHNALAASHAQRTVELHDGRIAREARGTITIMFSDIVGFSAMTERLGDVRVQEILHTHCAIVREQIAVYGGFEVKTQGDGFMIAFASARRALGCAVAIQRAMAAYDEHAEAPVRLRIGLHTGEATREGYDFFGRSVIVAPGVGGPAGGAGVLLRRALRAAPLRPGEAEPGARGPAAHDLARRRRRPDARRLVRVAPLRHPVRRARAGGPRRPAARHHHARGLLDALRGDRALRARDRDHRPPTRAGLLRLGFRRPAPAAPARRELRPIVTGA